MDDEFGRLQFQARQTHLQQDLFDQQDESGREQGRIRLRLPRLGVLHAEASYKKTPTYLDDPTKVPELAVVLRRLEEGV